MIEPTPWKPTAATHRLASMVFAAVGIIFLILFCLCRGTKYDWLALGLGVIGSGRAIWHFIRWQMSKCGVAPDGK